MPCIAVLIFLQGCTLGFNPIQVSEVPSGQVSITIGITQFSPSQLTETRQITFTPTRRATSTPTQEPTLTFTPLPTLDQRGIQGLIDDNRGCQLPCWWGIEPGKTTKQQARLFLEQITTTLEVGNYGYIEVDGKNYYLMDYSAKYYLPGTSDKGEMLIDLWYDSVVRIAVDEKTTAYHYTIDQLLTQMGKPLQVFVESDFTSMYNIVPFHLILHYPDRHFLANYYIEAKEQGDYILACPAKLGPELVMWAPEYQIEDRLEIETIGPDSRPGLQTLEDSTGLTIDEFYNKFSKLGNKECLKCITRFHSGQR
jgi:hypothetical protein